MVSQNINSSVSAVMELARPWGPKGGPETSGDRSLSGDVGTTPTLFSEAGCPGFLMPLTNAITQVTLRYGFGDGARRKKLVFLVTQTCK